MPKLFTIAKIALSVMLLSQSINAAKLNLVGISEGEKEKFIAKLAPRLDYIKTREASSWRADDAAFFLERLLIRAGHPAALVTWTLPGNNVITLNAEPGPLFKYGTISSPNLTAISQETLRQYFLQPLVETEFVKITQAPYIAEYSELGIVNVANYLKSLGYWNASVAIASEKMILSTTTYDLALDIETGNKLSLSPPSFQGATSQDLSIFKPKIEKHLSQPATTENINAIKKIVDDYYRENGYQFAEIDVTPNHGNSTTQLIFRINSGQQYSVHKIIVEGQDKTKKRRIRRYFDKLKGENYDKTAANKALNRLISTGAFSNVTITPKPHTTGDTSTLDLVVKVAEADAKAVSTYAGYGTYERYILGASYTDFNYHGSLRRVELKGELSGRGLLGEIGVNEPMFAGIPIQLNTRFFLTRRDYEGYDTDQAGGELSLTWRPSEKYATQLFAGGDFTSVSTDLLTDLELGPSDYIHTKVGISQTLNFKNSRVLPTKGFYSNLLLQAGNISGDAHNNYLMFDLQASYRAKITKKDSFNTRFSTGAISPESSSDLPIDVRLFAGGHNSQRAFDERELGPRSFSDDPLGGQAYWTASAEYTRVISDPFKLSLFYDVGQVYADVNDWGLNDPSHSLGLGVKIDLPIGPIRLEYGHNLNRKSGEPHGALHFAVGAAF